MEYLDLPTKTNIKRPKKRKKYKKRFGKESVRQGDSRFCQKCGKETTELYESVWGKKVSSSAFSSGKKDRKEIPVTIKVCADCFRKLTKKLDRKLKI